MITLLLNTIQELQNLRFDELSREVSGRLSHLEYDPLSKCFRDVAFARYFTDFKRKHGFSEHYYVSRPANILLLDRQGKPRWFLARTEAEMSQMVQFLIDHYNSEPIETLKATFDNIKNKELIYFAHEQDGVVLDLDECEKFLHPCEKVTLGDKTYYCALIQGDGGYGIDLDRIASIKAG